MVGLGSLPICLFVCWLRALLLLCFVSVLLLVGPLGRGDTQPFFCLSFFFLFSFATHKNTTGTRSHSPPQTNTQSITADTQAGHPTRPGLAFSPLSLSSPQGCGPLSQPP